MSRLPSLSSSVRRFASSLICAAVTCSTALASESPPADYTLFVGVDLFLSHQDQNVAITKLERKRALLDTPDRDFVRLNDQTGFQWKRATKVSGTVATIADLKTERTFSPANDPKMAALKTQANLQSYLSERLSVAQAAVAQSESQANFAAAAAANPYNSSPQSFDQTATGIVFSADSGLDSAMGDFDSVSNLALTEQAASPEDEATFDAVELTFTVSYPQPVSDAFAVIFARVKSGDVETNISFHHEIGQIGPNPRRVTATKFGFPFGFEIFDPKVHLFSHGEEIASNLSEKRYGLSGEQAREFMSIDHLGKHRRETIPAQPIWSLAPATLFSASAGSEFDVPVTVEVDASGRVTSWSTSQGALPSRVQTAVTQLNFLPALEKGVPVASTATVNLAQFFKN